MYTLHILVVIWCEDSIQHDRRQPCLVNLDGSVSNIHSKALIWHQGTSI